MDGKTYFNYAMELMKKYPPHITDMVMVSRMQRIGLTPANFDYENRRTSTMKNCQRTSKKRLNLLPKKKDMQLLVLGTTQTVGR